MRRPVLYFVGLCAVVWAAIELSQALTLGELPAAEYLKRIQYFVENASLANRIAFLAWCGMMTGLFAYPCAASLDTSKLPLAGMLGTVAWTGSFFAEALFAFGSGNGLLWMLWGSAVLGGLGASSVCLLSSAQVGGLSAGMRACAQICAALAFGGAALLVWAPFLAEPFGRLISLAFVGAFAGGVLTCVGHLLGAQAMSPGASAFAGFGTVAGPEVRMLCPVCGAVHVGTLGTVVCERCGCVYEERIVSRPERSCPN